MLGFLYYDAYPIGAIAVALMLGTSAVLPVPVDGPLLILAFCGTSLVYLADRGLGLSPEDHVNRPRRVDWIRRHRWWLSAEAIAYLVGIGVVLPLLQWQTLLIGAMLGGLGGVHSGLVLGGKTRIKAVGLSKPILIGGAWAVGAVVLPVVEAGEEIVLSTVLLVTYRFLLVVPNVLLADWVDREGDEAVGSTSVVHRWSGCSVRFVASALLGVAIVTAGMMVWYAVAPELLFVDAIGALLLLVGTWYLRPGEVSGHMFALDAIVAWPVVPWIISIFW